MQVARCNSLSLNPSQKIGFQGLFAPEGRETLTSETVLPHLKKAKNIKFCHKGMIAILKLLGVATVVAALDMLNK